MTFKRARNAEQVAIRRQEILDTARQLCEEKGVLGWSLNELGRLCSINKSNLYRYFSSREAVLFSWMVIEAEALASDLEQLALSGLDVAALADQLAGQMGQHPLLCQLIGISAAVLELNMDVESIVERKQALIVHLGRGATVLQQALDGLDAEQAFFVYGSALSFAGSLHPVAYPTENVQQVLQRPEFQCFQVDFEPTLSRFIRTLLLGSQADSLR